MNIIRPFYFLLLLGLLFLPPLLPAQTTVHSISYGGLTRSYRLHLPPGYNGSSPVPLVFNLHGYTSNAIQQEAYSEMNAVADTAGFIVCYPDGVSNAWNSGFSFPYGGGVDDVGFISTLIDLLATQYNIDLARVYSCGMSNGGFMSFRLACDLESRIAAIASVTGSMSTLQTANCNLARPVPVMQIHGTADATVPYGGGSGMISVDSVLSFWRNENACTDTALVYNFPDLVAEGSTITSYHNSACSDTTEVLHFKVTNGGHSWPGAIAVPNLGNTNQDAEGSVEIWKFFLRHCHPSPLAVSSPAPSLSSAQIFPNPGQEGFICENIQPGSRMDVYGMDGKLVWSQVLNETISEVDAKSWNPGIFWILIWHGDSWQALTWVKSRN